MDFFPEDYPPKLISSTCIPFSSRLFISASGNVYPCERTGFDFPLGKIEGEKLIVDVDSISELYCAIFERNNKLCSTCADRFDCHHCFLQDEDNFSSDIICSAYKPINKILDKDALVFIRNNAQLLSQL